MTTKKKKDDGKKKLAANKAMWNTSIEVPTKEPNFHSLRLRGKEVDLSCSTICAWITISPVSDITRDLQFCPACGQQLVSEVLFDKLKGVMPKNSILGKE